MSAEQALTTGVAHAVYPDDLFEVRVREFLAKLATRPYKLLGLAKLSIELATDLDRAQAGNAERNSNSILFTGEEHKSLVRKFPDRQDAKRKTKQ